MHVHTRPYSPRGFALLVVLLVGLSTVPPARAQINHNHGEPPPVCGVAQMIQPNGQFLTGPFGVPGCTLPNNAGIAINSAQAIDDGNGFYHLEVDVSPGSVTVFDQSYPITHVTLWNFHGNRAQCFKWSPEDPLVECAPNLTNVFPDGSSGGGDEVGICADGQCSIRFRALSDQPHWFRITALGHAPGASSHAFHASAAYIVHVGPVPSTGTIQIVKETVPSVDPQDFAFSGSGLIGAFTLDTTPGSPPPDQMTFDLDPGSYTVTKTMPEGWRLSALTCDDPSGDTTTTLASAHATIDLAAGEVVTCIFRAAQAPTAAFDFQADPDDPRLIEFDAADSTAPVGAIVAYAWVFGDGTTGTGETPAHRYAAPGTYSVTLTITDTEGGSDSQTQQVVVGDTLRGYRLELGQVLGTGADLILDENKQIVAVECSFGAGLVKGLKSMAGNLGQTTSANCDGGLFNLSGLLGLLGDAGSTLNNLRQAYERTQLFPASQVDPKAFDQMVKVAGLNNPAKVEAIPDKLVTTAQGLNLPPLEAGGGFRSVTPPAKDAQALKSPLGKIGKQIEQIRQSTAVMTELGTQIIQSNP